MTTLLTKKFKEHLTEQFVESITETANNVYYLVASRHFAFDDDENPPTPNNSSKEVQVDIYDEGIFGKKINSTDVYHMIPRYDWTSNTVYIPYDNTDGELFTKQFYVAVDGGATYYVYKCLDNNLGAPSTEQPASTSESACNFITTSDGYTWKLMYKLAEATFEKFATSAYMPVATSANVAGNTVSGALDVIRIVNTGSSYVATTTGQFNSDDIREAISVTTGNTTTYRLTTSASANNDFYINSALYISSGTGAGQIKKIIGYTGSNKVAVVESPFDTAPLTDSQYIVAPYVTITGDGLNATAYATVSSNATVNNYISRINIVSRGAGYTYAEVDVSGNTGGISNTATLRAIISPSGGHGANALEELGADSIGISLSYNTDESGFITVENDYRKFVVVKDPLINNVQFEIDSDVGIFTVNETIYQIDYKTLVGTIEGNNTTTTITGTGTELSKALKANDYVFITDNVTGLSCIRTIGGVTNSTSATISSNLAFTTASAKIAYAEILATTTKTGNSSPYIDCGNTVPKFTTGKLIIGASSGAVANLNTIRVGEKTYNNWNTLDNRTRVSYSASFGSMSEDSVVYQGNSASNAYFHSANSTFVFLTKGNSIVPNPSELIRETGGPATYTPGTTKYLPDMVRGSGSVFYIENKSPISRSVSQSETFRLVIKL